MSVKASEKERSLDEARAAVRSHAILMNRSLDQGRMMDGLKHASTLLDELRTDSLSPTAYYQLYISVCDELRSLEMCLADELSKGRRPVDVYEVVQYAGYVVPRLYLLITVGRVFMRAVPSATSNIITDLVEMCRGVQSPLRGLFLRRYLLQCTKDILPDTEDGGDEKTGTVQNSIEFIMNNFAEMNKLWVRMQHQGHTSERELRERERRKLQLVVGSNLERLSQLESVNADTYSKVVLPGIMEQVVSCRDPISQQYLMECVIQVFPDDFHLATLSELLSVCSEVNTSVNVKTVLISLIDRLARYATTPDGPGIPANIELFNIFQKQLDTIQGRGVTPPDANSVALHAALLNLAHKCYPDRLDYVDLMYESTAKLFSEENAKIPSESSVGREMQRLLALALDNYTDLTVLRLPHYSSCLQLLDFSARRDISIHLLERLVQEKIKVADHDKLEALLTMVQVLIVDQSDVRLDYCDEDFIEEQELVGKLIHQMFSDDVDEQFLILTTARRHFESGGLHRIRFTIPPLLFVAFQLVQRFHSRREQDEEWQGKVEKVFRLCHECISLLTRADMFELALRLFLQAAAVAGSVVFANSETVAYEFMSQAFTLYEEELSDSKAQMAALTLIVATLKVMSCFGEENHAPLRNQCALAAGKLLKKPDQCRAVSICAHLFWSGLTQENTELREGRRVLECLKKGLRVSSQCMESSVQCQLQVELLNSWFYFYAAGNPEISASMINQLLEKLRDNLPSLADSDEASQIRRHFDNTLAYIRMRAAMATKQGDNMVAFDAIECN